MQNKSMIRKLTATLSGIVLAAGVLAGCGSGTNAETAATVAAVAASTEAAAEETAEAASSEEAAAEASSEAPAEETASSAAITKDRAGNAITVPATVNKIVSLAPSTTRVLIELGLADKIVGTDSNSSYSYAADLTSLAADPFDMMNPDNEAIAALGPDIVFTSGMSSSGGADVFASLKEAGVCVADIPSSDSFEGIEEDLQFIGDCTGKSAEAKKLVSDMQDQLEDLSNTLLGVPDTGRKTVLFMISIPTPDYPQVYTTGKGTYMDEMITTAGGTNVCGDQESWVSLTEEDAVALDPDVIITNVNYMGNPIPIIEGLEGWENVTAVKNGAVYYVDSDTSNQPNEHVVDAVLSMAIDLYPDIMSNYEDPIADLNKAVTGTGDTADAADAADSASAGN